MKGRIRIRHFLISAMVASVMTGYGQKPADNAAPSATPAFTSPPVSLPPASKAMPLTTILALKQVGLADNANKLARIRGTLLDAQPGEYLVVNDETGTVFVETHQTSLPPVKAQVEVLGQPFSDGYSLSLKNAVVAPLSTGSATSNEPALPLLKPADLPVLTEAWAVRDLPAEKAAWNYPVRLRAVVTVNAKVENSFYCQDASAGIYVATEQIAPHLNPGDLITVEGVSDPGGFAPIVRATNVTVIGTAPLPQPRPETLYQLSTGQDGSQWIEVRGVVRSLTYSNGVAKLNLNDPSGVLIVNIPAPAEPTNLLDAVVRIKGACGSIANVKRQFVRFEMWASSLAEVVIEEPGAADPLILPVQPIASLGQFHPRQTMQHRVNIAGVVTFCDTESFFLQDAGEGVRVLAAANDTLQPGDYVMVAGYPGFGNYGYRLHDAVFKVISHRPVPPPQILTPEKSLDPQLHNRRVQIRARLLHYTQNGAADVLTLQTGDRIFEARCHTPVSDRIKRLATGSQLQITGIYQVLADEARVPSSFQFTVPTEQDVVVLDEPSWWTLPHTTKVVVGMAAMIGATILWGLLLRRKVQAQTASLRQSEKQFRSLVEQSLVGVYIVQGERFVYVNPRMAAIFGYRAEVMMSSCRLDDVIFREDMPLVREQIRQRLDDEIDYAHYFFRGRRPDGSLIQVEVLGSRTEVNGQPAVLGMLLDVTERKLAEAKIAEQARMLDLASDAIMVCDLEDRILYWNHSAERIYGWTPQAAIGGLAFEKMRIHPEEFQQAKQALQRDRHWHGEFIHEDAQGKEITVAARWTLVPDAQGKPGAILAINTDITQPKQMESQFLRAQRLESIGVLAGGIAHDLNNTLAPILMSAHLLEIEPDAADRQNFIANIITSAERAANLVRQILTFARGTNGRRVAIQPRHLLDELRNILGQTLPKSIQLRLNIAPDVWTVAADATQLHQVLMNLCINARDAMPQGGELTLAATNITLDKHFAKLNQEAKPGPYVIFSITDTGCGMAPEIRDRIFDPFFTTKAVGKGTGLGLSTALGIIKSHGGFIGVYSEINRGSSFKVYMPALLNMPAKGSVPNRNAPMFRGNNELILVVDDEPIVRNVAQQILKMFGYRVITANDGAEAITYYTQHQNEIMLVLLDMMMPVLDGPATIHALARINPQVKIIAASGLTSEEDLPKINSPTIKAFIPKPYTAEQMLNTIHDLLHPKATNS